MDYQEKHNEGPIDWYGLPEYCECESESLPVGVGLRDRDDGSFKYHYCPDCGLRRKEE